MIRLPPGTKRGDHRLNCSCRSASDEQRLASLKCDCGRLHGDCSRTARLIEVIGGRQFGRVQLSQVTADAFWQAAAVLVAWHVKGNAPLRSIAKHGLQQGRILNAVFIREHGSEIQLYGMYGGDIKPDFLLDTLVVTADIFKSFLRADLLFPNAGGLGRGTWRLSRPSWP